MNTVQLHTLTSSVKRRGKKRVGRGGKRGTFSGRGSKGQHARAGRKIRPAERDLFMRIPKLRGIKNIRRQSHAIVLDIANLERIAGAVTEITPALLVERGIISNTRERVKILGNSLVKRAFTIKDIPISEGAKKKIEAAGGSVVVAK